MLTDLKSNLASFRKPMNVDTLISSTTPMAKPMATTPAKEPANINIPKSTIIQPIKEVDTSNINEPINYASNLNQINTLVESQLTIPIITTIQSDLIIERTTPKLQNNQAALINYTLPILKLTSKPTDNIRTKVISINKLIQQIAFKTPILKNTLTNTIKYTLPVLQNNQSVIEIKSPVSVSVSKLTGNVFIKDIKITKVDQKRLETGYTKQSPDIFKSKLDTSKLISYSGTSIFTKSFVDKSKFNVDTIKVYSQKTKFTKPIINSSKYNLDSLPSKFSPGKYTPTKLYPESILKNTSTRWKGNVPPAVNFIVDTAAKGFTVKYDSSKFVGINGTTYTYPIKGKSVLQVGNYSLNNQLGTGSPKVKSLGFTSTKRYEDAVKATAQQSILGTWSVTRRSPSPIDDQYTKFNLQLESYNPTYINQPYITRGIQNGLEPERWGSTFDDGLIRGGAATAASRILYDTIRLGKYTSSPKGLLWIAKQVGLGLTRPNGLNRIQTGVKSLLSLAGGATGLRFPAHGGTSIIKYEDAIRALTLVFNTNSGRGDRLTELKSKLSNNSLIIDDSWGGPQSVYGLGSTTLSRVVNTSQFAIANAKQNNYTAKYRLFNKYLNNYIPSLFNDTKAATTGFANQTITDVDRNGLRKKLDNFFDPGYATSDDWLNLKGSSADITTWKTLSYGQIPKKTKRKSNIALDFKKLQDNVDPDSPNAQIQNTLETKYGFGSLDSAKTSVPQKGKGSFITSLNELRNDKNALAKNPNFKGDKINAVDIGIKSDIYDASNDLIDFYFLGVAKNQAMAFRATLTGFTDDFSPGWNNINIMGRPDGSYIYTAFERTVSFTFRVAALSRSEMIPIWRKLNYLATYTMPDFSTARASGPMMRLTLGNLFQETPGFLNSFSISIPDDATWDIAEDADENNLAKQLPTVVDVSVGYTVIADYRPQLGGRAYSLSIKGANNKDTDGNWLFDSMDVVKVGKKSKAPVEKTGA